MNSYIGKGVGVGGNGNAIQHHNRALSPMAKKLAKYRNFIRYDRCVMAHRLCWASYGICYNTEVLCLIKIHGMIEVSIFQG